MPKRMPRRNKQFGAWAGWMDSTPARTVALLVPLLALSVFFPVHRATLIAVFMTVCIGGVPLVRWYVDRRCAQSDREVARFREMAEAIFRNVGAGLLLFDDKGMILMANEHACKILGQSEDSLAGTSLKSHMAADWVREHVGFEKDVTQCYFRRADGSNFPVSFEIATVMLPEDAVPGKKGTGMIEAVIMAFTDIGPILDLQRQIKNAERLRAAANLASEIAHEIRNPLAAISGSAQVLQMLKKKSALGNLRLQEVMAKEQDDALERIVNESQRLDGIIERFINYTEASPEAYSKLEGYIEQSRADQDRMATYTAELPPKN